MNKIFKVIWSKTKNRYVVVSEIAKRSGKCSTSLNKKIIAAFLAAGTVLSVTGSAWAAPYSAGGGSATGTDAVAIGADSKAADDGSIAIGPQATVETPAENPYGDDDPYHRLGLSGGGIAIGDGAAATNEGAVSMGRNSSASGLHAFALGARSVASGDNSLAISQEAKATGYQSFALGAWSEASGSGSITIGYQSAASNTNATAIGGFAEASGPDAIAIGGGNSLNKKEDGSYYYDWGRAANASGAYAIAIGNMSEATGAEGVAVGSYSHAEGEQSSAYGYYSLATGPQSSAYGYYSRAEGEQSSAYGYYSYGKGNQSAAYGYYSNATGNYASAFGGFSQAAGYMGAASGFYARAAGNYSTAIGSYSHAEGLNAIATGYQSHAIGENSSAFGAQAVANDKNTSAFGLTSNAYGEGGVALGHSTATGVLTKTVQGSDGTYIAGTYTQDELDGTTVTKHYVFRMKADGSGVVAYDTIGKNYYEATDVGSGTYTIGAATTVDEGSLVMGGIAIGSYAHVEGDRAMSIGRASGAYGKNSTAVGLYANALGEGAMALGHGTVTGAEGITISRTDPDDPDSHTITLKTDAYGNPVSNETYGGIAIGSYSHATGERSMAIGRVSGAYDENSTAMGLYSNAFGEGAMAIGHNATAGAEVTTAVDPDDPDRHTAVMTLYDADGNVSTAGTGKRSTTADGTPTQGGIAFGSYAHAVGDRAIAFGRASGAYGTNSTAMGIYANAYGEGAMTIGHDATAGAKVKIAADPDAEDAHIVTIVRDGDGEALQRTLKIDGTQTGTADTPDSELSHGGIAIGSYTHSEGDRALSIGRASGAYGKNSTALGIYANALGEGAMAIGHGTVTGAADITISRTDPDDPDSHTITLGLTDGNPVSNDTYGGIAIGSYSHATGERSMAIGRVSGAYNENSTAMGLYSNAFGEGAMAIGHNATAGAEVTIVADPDDEDRHTAVMTLYDADGNVSTSGTGKRSTTGETNADGSPVYTQGGIAFGSYAHAVGDRAIAFGRVSGAYGANSTSMGIYSNAMGQGDIAIGHGSSTGVTVTVVPSGDEGTAEWADGFWTTTLETNEETGNPVANGNDGGIAIGSYAHTEGTRAMAIGRVAGAYGMNTTVVGLRSNAYGEGSMAFGHGVTAGKDDPDDPLHTRYAKQITELHNNPELEYDLDGVDPTLVDGKEVRVDPDNVIGAVAMGSYAEATGRGSLSVGRYSKAASAYSTTLGIRAQVLESAENAIAIGREATVDALEEGRIYGGINSISIGTLTSVKGQNSIAIGSADMLSDDGTEIVATADRKPTSVTGDNSIAIGMNDTVEGTSSIAIGTGHTVKGDGSGAIGDPSYIEGDNSYAIGNNNNIAVNDGFILGNDASVTTEGGVALGTNAIASTDKGVAGYDPTTGEASTATDDPTWTATAAAVSVGGGTPTDTKVTVTRQITNVAAGKEDTDAVNVAQLKQAVAAMPVVKSSDESVTVTKSEENGVITFDLSVEGAGTDTTYTMTSTQTEDKGEGTTATVTLTGSDDTVQTVDIVDTNTHTSVKGDEYISVEQTKKAVADAGPEYTVSLNLDELKKVIDTDTRNTVAAGEKITVDEVKNEDGSSQYTINGANVAEGDNITVDYDKDKNEFTVATAADVKFENVEVTNEFKAGDTVINEGGITTNEIKAGDTVINEGGVTTNNIETKNINVTENITYKGDKIVTDVTYEGDSNTLTVTKGDEVTEYTLKGNTYKGDNKTINISEDNVVSVIEGNVAEGDKGLVTGDTVYNETHVKNDGNYVKKDNTAADNITALDEKVYENSQNIENLGNAINNTSNQINNLDNRMRKGLAGAAALAALHPMDFNPDDKLQFSAGVGNYRGETAAAVGAFYRPDESVMFSIGGTFGNGDNMVNAGITFGLDGNKNRITRSRTAMAHEIVELRGHIAKQDEQIARLTDLVNKLVAPEQRLDNPSMFPDVPENHWAYAYLEDLQKRGIVEGYPDGQFKGDRAMTRYEFAAMMDRALQKGEKLDARIAEEFESELGRIYIERIKGQDNDRKKVERVRVNNSDSKYPEGKTRDVYGGKIVTEVPEKVAAAK